MTWHGMAWHGAAWHGAAWHDDVITCTPRKSEATFTLLLM
jgi:hypothetical protein